jgi:hypothetical protein
MVNSSQGGGSKDTWVVSEPASRTSHAAGFAAGFTGGFTAGFASTASASPIHWEPSRSAAWDEEARQRQGAQQQ